MHPIDMKTNRTAPFIPLSTSERFTPIAIQPGRSGKKAEKPMAVFSIAMAWRMGWSFAEFEMSCNAIAA